MRTLWFETTDGVLINLNHVTYIAEARNEQTKGYEAHIVGMETYIFITPEERAAIVRAIKEGYHE